MKERQAHERKTLAAWRKDRDGMAQWKLAAEAHIAPSTLAYIEQGRSRPGYDTMQALANALGIPIEQIELPEYRPYNRKKKEQ